MGEHDFELTLHGMAHGGSAVGRHEGKAIFVPYAIPGERITARLTEEHKRYAFAEGVRLLAPSPHRVTPRCAHFGPKGCGGCHFQHIAYEAQLEYKRDVVADQLQRIGGFSAPTVLPTLPSPQPWHYRSHATFHVNAEGRLCFVGAKPPALVPIEVCHILRTELLELLALLDLDVPTLERVRLQVGSASDDRMIVLSTRDDSVPELLADLPVSVNFLLSDNVPFNLIGASHVRYRVRGRTFRVTAGGFFQVNVPMAERLVEVVLERLALRQDETVLDLYAGVGLFTAFLAERAALVTSVESYPPSVSDADVNLAAFDNVDLIEGAVEAVLPALSAPYDAVVLDPPRSGIDVRVVDALGAMRPQRIVMVSCEPSTLARDARRLVRKGYQLVSVQPLDMFPQTYHVESVAHFVRQG